MFAEDDLADSKPYVLAKPERRRSGAGGSGPAGVVARAWRGQLGGVQKLFRKLNQAAYLVSIPFLMILVLGTVVGNRPMALFGATVVVLLNIGRLVAGTANLAVIPLRDGIDLKKMKKPLGRVIEPAVTIGLVVLAFTFIPWLSSAQAAKGSIADRIRSGAKALKQDMKGQVDQVVDVDKFGAGAGEAQGARRQGQGLRRQEARCAGKHRRSSRTLGEQGQGRIRERRPSSPETRQARPDEPQTRPSGPDPIDQTNLRDRVMSTPTTEDLPAAAEVIELEPTMHVDRAAQWAESDSGSYQPRPAVGIGEGSLASLAGETETLRRRRLLAAAVSLTAAFGVILVWVFASDNPGTLTVEGSRFSFRVAMIALRCLLAVSVAGLLASEAPLTRKQLRMVEYVLFLGVTLIFMVSQYFVGLDLMHRGPEYLPILLAFIKDGVIQMLALMMIYGTLIPNPPAVAARLLVAMFVGPVPPRCFYSG